jgi:hypothetical protein
MLSEAVAEFVKEFKTSPTVHQINLFIAGWFLDNKMTLERKEGE